MLFPLKSIIKLSILSEAKTARYLRTISSSLLITSDSAPLTLNAKFKSSGNKLLLHFLKLFASPISHRVASQLPPFSTRTPAQYPNPAQHPNPLPADGRREAGPRVAHSEKETPRGTSAAGFPDTPGLSHGPPGQSRGSAPAPGAPASRSTPEPSRAPKTAPPGFARFQPIWQLCTPTPVGSKERCKERSHERAGEGTAGRHDDRADGTRSCARDRGSRRAVHRQPCCFGSTQRATSWGFSHVGICPQKEKH